MTQSTPNPRAYAAQQAPRHRLSPLVFAAMLLASTGPVQAAEPAATTPAQPTRCDPAAPMPAGQLVGLWQLTLWADQGSPEKPVSQGAMLFQPHPEYPGSVRGRLKRTGPGNDLEAQLSGDVVNGEFNLDESDDGVRMSATWIGTPLDCGTRLRGVREPAQAMEGAGTVLQFELRKTLE